MKTFTCNWSAKVLPKTPMILPARQYMYPQRVAGEDEAMQRGALYVEVKPMIGANFLAMCALGFKDPTLPTSVMACPRSDDMLALAGGYAYLIDTLAPERSVHLPLKPVTQVLSAPANGLLFLAGFHHVVAVDAQGMRWQSGRLSWEGISLQGVRDGRLHGMGWNLHTNTEVPFTVDLETGVHRGGGFG